MRGRAARLRYMRSMPALNATAASILGFLEQKPMSGWDLAATIEDVIGDFWNVTKSQIYRELKLLADAGMVSTMRSGKRDKQPYRITPAGSRAFRAWIGETSGPPIMRMPLVLQVFFAEAVAPAALARSLAELREYHVKRLARYREFEHEVPKDTGSYQALRLGLSYQKLMIDWIDSLQPPEKMSKKRKR